MKADDALTDKICRGKAVIMMSLFAEILFKNKFFLFFNQLSLKAIHENGENALHEQLPNYFQISPKLMLVAFSHFPTMFSIFY